MKKIQVEFNQVQTCPLCRQPFDASERKYPRIMFCGHSVCSQCIKNEIRLKNSIKCLTCKVVFTKEQCVNFKLNDEYINMIQFLEANFGKSFEVYQNPSSRQIEQIETTEYLRVGRDQFDYELKCKNPGCMNKTELIFCSSECQAHYDEVETKKNEGGFRGGRPSG